MGAEAVSTEDSGTAVREVTGPILTRVGDAPAALPVPAYPPAVRADTYYRPCAVVACQRDPTDPADDRQHTASQGRPRAGSPRPSVTRMRVHPATSTSTCT
ncbi:hypothetical protein NKG05_26410 [Oerskovia sp. M15]